MDNVKKTFWKVAMLVVCLLLSVTLTSPAGADVMYTYTGQPFYYFEGFGAPSPPYTEVTGTLTMVNALPPLTTISEKEASRGEFPILVSWSFTDGINVYRPFSYYPNPPYLSLTTDAAGKIVAWDIQLVTFFISTMLQVSSNYHPADETFGKIGVYDAVSAVGWPSSAASTTGSGTWSGPAPVPEPSTMLLLGSSLVGLVGFRRKLGK